MSSGKGSVTTGYRYYLGLHMVLCQAMDYLRAVRMEDKVAWTGLANDGQIHINKPALFGDPDVEGGFVSLVDIAGGGDSQTVNDYLQTLLEQDDIPAFRGVVSAIYRQAYIGNAPFLRKIWHHVTSIYQTYNNWLPQYAPVPSRGLSVSDREGGWIYFAIDVSYSMFDPSFERWTYAETLITNALTDLKGKSPNLFFATFDENTTARATLEYLSASDADIDAAIAWVEALTYSATAGSDVASDYRGGVADAVDFFAQDDDPDPVTTDVYDGVYVGDIPDVTPGDDTNASTDGSRQLFFVSDGRADPESSAVDARATLDTINNLQIHGLAINNSDSTSADILTNLPTNLGGSLGSTEVDYSVDLDTYTLTTGTARPAADYTQWQVVADSWPLDNRLNFTFDSFGKFTDDWGDLYDNHNTGSGFAYMWFEVDAEDGATLRYRQDYSIYRNTVTAVSIAQYESLHIYGLTATDKLLDNDGALIDSIPISSDTAYTEGYTNRSLEIEWTHDADTYVAYRVRLGITPAFIAGGGGGYRVTNYSQPTITVVGGATEDLGDGVIQDALIDHYDINPVHILRDLVLNPIFGGSEDESEIGDSFAANAATCFNEGMGVSFYFENARDKEGIKQAVEEHMDGHMFWDRSTGKWETKLIRDDYTVGSLFTFDTSEITDWVSLERPLQEDLPNQVTVTYTKRENGEPASVTLHNVAAIQQVGRIIPVKREYIGITVEDLAASIALRDLRGLTVPLWRGQFRCRYVPTSLNLGSAFILTDSRVGLSSVVCRITEIDDGDGRKNEALVSFVEDKFNLDTEAIIVSDTIVEPDKDTAEAPNARLVMEMPYFVAAVTAGDVETDSQLDDDNDLGYLLATCDRPNQFHHNALISKYNGSDWYRAGVTDFSPYSTLSAAMDGDADTTTFTCPSNDDLYKIKSNDLIQIDDEIMTVSNIAVASDVATVTVGRGALDTVPRRHESGAAVFFWFNTFGTEFTPYTSGQSEDVKLLPRTRSEILAPSDAVTDSVTFASRMIRPYPPGKFQLEAQYSLSGVQTGDLDGTWNHRDRLTQTAIPAEDYTDDDVGPEATTSYTPMRRMGVLTGDLFDLSDLFDVADIFVSDTRNGPYEYSSTTGKTHTFTADDADLFDASDIFDLSDLFDDAFGTDAAFIELGVKSTRGGYDNWQTKWIKVDPLLPPTSLTAAEV